MTPSRFQWMRSVDVAMQSCGIAELRPRARDIVVARISEVKGLSDLHKPGILDSSTLFIRRLRDHNRLSAPHKVNTILAARVPKGRCPLPVLCAIEYYEFAIFPKPLMD